MAKKPARREFLDELAEFAESQRLLIEAEVEGFPTDPKAKSERVKRGREDFGFFMMSYFPHYAKAERSALHEYLFARLPELATNGRGDHDATAAPRGEAKSTICTLVFPIWCVVYGIKHYIPIIMDAGDQACTMLEAIKAELDSNPRLMADFPEATGTGRVWQTATIVTKNNRKLQAFGSGKRMRGLRHGPHRPDLVICDDLENDENVRSPEQRDKLEKWLKRTVLPLGPSDGSMDIVVIGTVLHYDSVLSRLLKSRTWKASHFRSIRQWPGNMALWDQFEEILHNEDEPAAVAFYQANQADMDEGAEVSWPSMRPLLTLMLIRAEDHGAFDSEHQNDPVSLEDNPFAECITFWVNRLPEWVFYGACDPSLGKNNRSRDPSAVLVGGFNKNTGILDVVEASIKRRTPDRIISDIIELQRLYRCQVWGIEAVQFQEFLRTELVKRSAQQGVPVPARPVNPHTDKALRIEGLQPHMANGLIRLHPGQRTLIDMFRHYPDADHDDGPDCTEILWKVATGGQRKTYQSLRLKGV